ncbi:rod-binding protein [Pseudochelatococcus sp. B33]
MAVSLPADIVMDVARAADPARFQAAVGRLESGVDYAAVARDVALAFASDGLGAADGTERPRGVHLPLDAERARLRLDGRDGFSGATDVRLADGLLNADRLREGSAYEQFEALTLQKFVEAILPKQGEAWFGRGFAGDTWKSFLAQQVAAELARAGGIGIARMVERVHPGDGQARTAADALRSASGVGGGVAAAHGLAPGGSMPAGSV